ncbi:MAG: DUF488 domain-containing protein [Actinomycetota bacterium]|nr:DUF488 domain-containing protein [Actinomycetota bacterium]
MSFPFFTVGHSNRTADEFVSLLTGAEVEVVVDVRRLPGSRRYPHFNEDRLSESLRQAGVDYRRIIALGGRRPKSGDLPPDVNAFWENQSFHNYADHALTTEFRGGLKELRDLGRERPAAIMCSEAVWWRCHRRIIADHLLAGGEDVRHIMAPGRIDTAELTRGAVVGSDGRVTYPG